MEDLRGNGGEDARDGDRRVEQLPDLLQVGLLQVGIGRDGREEWPTARDHCPVDLLQAVSPDPDVGVDHHWREQVEDRYAIRFAVSEAVVVLPLGA